MRTPLIAVTMDQSPATDLRPFARGRDLYFINAAYIRYLEDAECLPLALPTWLKQDLIPELIHSIDGLLLTGGDDVFAGAYGEATIPGTWRIDPPRTYFEIALITEALRQNKPLFGICRGCQMINVALGGTLYQDIASQIPGAQQHRSPDSPVLTYHSVEIESGSRLENILGKSAYTVNSSHHQAIRTLAASLRVTALAEDGVIEGIERPGAAFVLGVQWHPETMQELSGSKALLEAFLSQCRKQAGER
ncbi:MAG TPA: gamma-glutamyl-gamma-aminobutyrate hydrolase family protein [bacterium]|nr:gamma-glutamyl-gamma-aminobutyrate hydrolase family protein [bacterium]HQG44912.1 gamma-glutamyl-gamma-aminobutyrate hydrolase family protein [bacterium]HQI49420.1 gamma-glutamyl-gamma-aminobutyrate hydrolase family protein [bacterium]HQJ66232.1 gamma-glutamyl-gamma-aminobutyrate hydrolase family protein [bacterium]